MWFDGQGRSGKTRMCLIPCELWACAGFASESSYAGTAYLIVREEGNILVDSPRFHPKLRERIKVWSTYLCTCLQRHVTWLSGCLVCMLLCCRHFPRVRSIYGCFQVWSQTVPPCVGEPSHHPQVAGEMAVVFHTFFLPFLGLYCMHLAVML